jgi:hypothetical protein
MGQPKILYILPHGPHNVCYIPQQHQLYYKSIISEIAVVALSHRFKVIVPEFMYINILTKNSNGSVDGRLSYQISYGFASGQIPRRSQGTLLPSSGESKVSNPWNNVQCKDSI